MTTYGKWVLETIRSPDKLEKINKPCSNILKNDCNDLLNDKPGETSLDWSNFIDGCWNWNRPKQTTEEFYWLWAEACASMYHECTLYTSVCVYTYIHTYLPTYLPTYVRTYVRTYIPTYVHTYIRTYLHTFIHTYIHTYVHTYIHTYTRWSLKTGECSSLKFLKLACI